MLGGNLASNIRQISTTMDLFSDDERVPRPEGRITLGSPDSDSELVITINEDYANRFQHNHERAELHRLQEKYGPAAAQILARKRGRERDDGGSTDHEEDESEDETEDEEGEQVTAEVDAAILRTLVRIRNGDESIYDSEKRIFDEEKAWAATVSNLRKIKGSKVNKKVTLADYQRSRLKDFMANSEDPALALTNATTFQTRGDKDQYAGNPSLRPLSYVQEQEQIRKQLTQAFHTMGGDTDGDAEKDEFFTKRRVGDDFDEEEDTGTYKEYLLSSLGNEKSVKAVREALRNVGQELSSTSIQPALASTRNASSNAEAEALYVISKERKDPVQQSDEEFLMNYILNRGWIDNPNAAPKLSRTRAIGADSNADKASPSTRRAAAPHGQTDTRDWDAEAAELESEASFDSRADAFEQAFNFRYEAMEAGEAPAQVQSYARNTQNSVRRVEDKRKKEREERKKRKEQEKRESVEEINRLRNLKKNQLREKLKQLKEAAGSQKIKFDPLELEGDFDEKQHEVMMAVFDDQYYDDDAEADEDVKPTWDDDIDIVDILAEEKEHEEAAQASSSKNHKKDKKKAKKAANAKDEDAFEMDADFMDGEGHDTVVDMSKLSKKERKKLKKKLKAQASKGQDGADGYVEVACMDADVDETRNLPATEEDRKATAKKLADEYRSLEFEDVIGGDLTTRFHYTRVPKTKYGLSPAEILLADDKDLNEVVALKHIQPYRRGGDKRPRDLNRRVKELRKKLEADAEAHEGMRNRRKRLKTDAGEAGEVRRTKRPGKKERQKAAAAIPAAAVTVAPDSKAVDPAPLSGSSNALSTSSEGVNGAADSQEKARRRKEKKERKGA